MANISPVSDLRNYNKVLEKVSVGSPVYLTVSQAITLPCLKHIWCFIDSEAI